MIALGKIFGLCFSILCVLGYNFLDLTSIRTIKSPFFTQIFFYEQDSLKFYNGQIALLEIDNYKFVWRGDMLYTKHLSKFDYFHDIGPNMTWEVENTVAYVNQYCKRPYVSFSEKFILIPLKFQRNTRLSLWALQKDSISFYKFLYPILDGTYATVELDTVVTIFNKKIVIGKNIGGEGGSAYNSLWIREATNDSLIIIEEERHIFNGFIIEHEYLQNLDGLTLKRHTFIDSMDLYKDTISVSIKIDSLLNQKY